ncbi:regulatory protein, luxR family [Nocardioides sp. YR527]|uniref:ATP-binding protein n=1 Tax=Nocardioides sp. YR527 TaxID=1881028 RepID=UPI00088CFE28|nr:LuxR family transcriptional regulator [Nocardioides sp. YR527]SDL17881.1 regulatory protein, luxR family [Nocardioides sp. YR527]
MDALTSRILVGRDAELAQVRSAIDAAPAIVVIEGEAGIGKSRLVGELIDDDPKRLFLLGHCQHLLDPFPLGPVVDALRGHADRIERSALSPVVGSLGALIPEVADRLPPPPEPLADQQEARHRTFRAATELLGHLAPGVLVLEDLHWADRVTVDFLAFLAANQPPDLSILVTTRPEAAAPLVREAFARGVSGPARTVTLRELGPESVGELARTILATDVPEETAAALFDVTGGVPFVVEEVLRTLLEREPAAEIPRHPDAIAALSVSTALRDVVRERVAALDAMAAEVLGAAAVADQTVDAGLIAEVTGHDLRKVARALDAAYAIGLLHDHEGRGRFRHVLAQQVVYDDVPPQTRRWLHLRTAQVLEESDGVARSARIAHHYQRAGRPAEFVRHAEAAADEAIRRGNDAVAADLLRQATADMASLPPETRVRLATKLGRAAVDGLAHAEAMPILGRLLDEEDLPPPARGELRFALGRLQRQQGHARAGFRAIERAVPDLEARPDLQARALAVLAVPETVVDVSIATHLERCEQAEAAAERAGAADVGLSVLITRGSLLLEQGRPEAWDLIDAVRRDGVLIAHPREHARAAVNWAQGALHSGHLRRADELVAEGRAVAEAAGFERVIEVYALVSAMADYESGRWDGLADRVRDLATPGLGFGAASLDARLLHGLVLTATATGTDAREQLAGVIAECERVGSVWPLIPAQTALSRLLLSTGDAHGSLAQARAAVDQAGRKGLYAWAAAPMLCLVDAAVAIGTVAEVRAEVADLARHLGDADAPAALAAVRTCEALVAQADGEAAAVERLLASARHTAAAAGLVYVAAQVEERLGDWRCTQAADSGPALLEGALRTYGGLDARRDIARVTQLMRRHGVAVPYPWRGGRRGHGTDLSDREREIALLAAAGRTNREIAAELFLSPRTVETHMSHALRKLGLRSREELRRDSSVLSLDGEVAGP